MRDGGRLLLFLLLGSLPFLSLRLLPGLFRRICLVVVIGSLLRLRAFIKRRWSLLGCFSLLCIILFLAGMPRVSGGSLTRDIYIICI